MKKLLILLALCMVFSVVLVACETEPETPAESSTESNTEAPTTQAPTTAEPTTEDQTTEPETNATTEDQTTEPTTDATTEEVTTEPTTDATTEEVTTEPTPEPVKVIAGMSWDALATKHPVKSKTIVSDGTAYGTWDGIANVDTNDTALSLFGWIAYFTATEGTVGYAFNDGEHIYNEGFTFTAEIGVQNFIATNCPGALSACRFQFDIPLEGLSAGTHKLVVYAKDTADNEQVIREITLNIVEVDPVEAVEAVEFDGTNGTVTIAAGGFYKFLIVNQGGKTMNIANSANCTVTADTYTLPADTIDANGARVQEIPGEDWDNFELTIVNETDAAVEIVLTIQ